MIELILITTVATFILMIFTVLNSLAAEKAAERAYKQTVIMTKCINEKMLPIINAALSPKSGTHVLLPLGAVLEAVKRLEQERKQFAPDAGETLSEVKRIALRTSEESVESEADCDWQSNPPASIVDIVRAEMSGAPDKCPYTGCGTTHTHDDESGKPLPLRSRNKMPASNGYKI